MSLFGFFGKKENVKTVYSTKQSEQDVAVDIKRQLKNVKAKVIIYFASSKYDQGELANEMADAFKKAEVFGCSTTGEIVSGRMLKNSVVAMALSDEIVEDIKIEIIENISSEDQVKNAITSFEQYYNESMKTMNIRKYVGVVLMDGLSASEEKLMEKLGDSTDVTFIGGSAGDDLKFERTYVCAEGRAFTNAAILALVKPKVGFDFIKTQSFKTMGKSLVATKVREQARQVLEFDGKPAVEAYAEALGVSKGSAAESFMSNPVGLVAGDDIYVRSPQQVKDESIVFYCNILEGMEVSLLKSTDIINDTKEAIENKKREIGDIAGIINFNCILRTLELEKNNQTEQYGDLFEDIPTIGFSTYGEALLGHINQTATMLVFKKSE